MLRKALLFDTHKSQYRQAFLAIKLPARLQSLNTYRADARPEGETQVPKMKQVAAPFREAIATGLPRRRSRRLRLTPPVSVTVSSHPRECCSSGEESVRQCSLVPRTGRTETGHLGRTQGSRPWKILVLVRVANRLARRVSC